jgi:hypothetical protein
MPAVTTLLLVGTEPHAREHEREQICGQQLFTQQAQGFGFLYTDDDRACIDLAERLGDRLWLQPRRQVGLSSPNAWLELLSSHHFASLVAVVPAAALDASLARLGAADVGVRIAVRDARMLELSLCTQAL